MKADERVSDVVRGSHVIDQPCCRVQHRMSTAHYIARPEDPQVRRYHSPVWISPG